MECIQVKTFWFNYFYDKSQDRLDEEDEILTEIRRLFRLLGVECNLQVPEGPLSSHPFLHPSLPLLTLDNHFKKNHWILREKRVEMNDIFPKYKEERCIY